MPPESQDAATSQSKRAHLEKLLRDRLRDAPAKYPPSVGQRGLWYLHLACPESPAYNINFTARIHSSLDGDVLRAALSALLDRHDSFRTQFILDEDGPIQQVVPRLPLNLHEADARDWPAERLYACLSDTANRPFDLGQAPLLRAVLLHCGPHDHILSLTVHHIIGDLWSLFVVLREFGVLYAMGLRGAAMQLPPLPARYRDFVRWQQQLLSSPEGERLANYWSQQLAGEIESLRLPTDRDRSVRPTFQGSTLPLSIDRDTSRRLVDLADHEHVTLFTLVLAVFQVLLYRYTRQRAISVGTPVSGRSRGEFAEVVGYFVNMVVVTSRLDGRSSFREFLRAAKPLVVGALEHQDYPLGMLVEKLRPARDASASPWFQVAFALQKSHIRPLAGILSAQCGRPGKRFDLNGLEFEPLAINMRGSQFDLTLMMQLDDGQLEGFFEYDTDIFDAATVERLKGHFQSLMRDVVSHPDRTIDALKMECSAGGNYAVTAAPPRDRQPEFCAVQQFAQRAAQLNPTEVAVIAEGESLTYRELDEFSTSLARHLGRGGIRRDQRVALCMYRTSMLPVALLAVLKSGAAYVPLDPYMPVRRLEEILADASPSLVLCQAETVNRLPAGIPRLELPRDPHRLTSLEGQEELPSVIGEDLAYVTYTSGSTGRPKGVAVQHRSVVNVLDHFSRQLQLLSSDRLLAVSSLSFDISALELFLMSTVGGSVTLASREEAFDGERLASCIDRNRPTIVQATPATWRLLLAAGWSGDPQLTALCGGEEMTLDLAARLMQRCRALYNVYGPTETTIWSTDHCIQQAENAISVGRPIADTSLYVLDERGQALPVGAQGTLHIGGTGVAREYWHRPELSAERFLPDPFVEIPGVRMFNTNDLASLRPDGTVRLHGRRDRQVKLRGFRIELGDVEAALQSHDAVTAVAAIVDGRDPARRQLIAYVSPRGGADEAELKAFLRERLPGYMVPQRIVALDSLPMTAAGKIDRRSLPAVAPLENVHSVLPQDDLETRLLELWRSVLNVPDAGVTDDFFELGGHSLLAVELTGKAAALEIPLTPSALIHATTVRDLAAWVRQNSGADLDAGIVQLQASGKKPPICWIHSAGGDVLAYRHLVRLLGGDRPIVAVETRGPADRSVAPQSVQDLAKRYTELLRAAFPTGPWYLGGHSVGGLIALEMANQLTRAGQQVSAVFLLDTVAGEDLTSAAAVAGREKLEASLQTTLRHWERLGGPPVALGELGSDTAGWKTLTSTVLDKLRGIEMPDAIRTRLELACQHLQAAALYVPPAYSGRVILYQAHADAARQAAWLPETAQRVSVPGDHFSILEPPNVDVLGEHLRQALAEVDASKTLGK